MLKYRERIHKLLAVLGNHSRCEYPLLRGASPVQTQEYHTGMSPTLPEYQLPKVLIRRYQEGSFLRGELKNIVVGDSRTHLRHVRDVMAARSERLDDLTLHALVAQKLQGEPLDTG
jgi:hypothetical protein